MKCGRAKRSQGMNQSSDRCAGYHRWRILQVS